MLVGKINLQKFPGSKLLEKNGKYVLCIPAENNLYVGEKGCYADLAIIETPNNQYGDSHVIVQSISKERREAGEQGVVLGNCKTLQSQAAQAQSQAAQASSSSSSDDFIPDDSDDLPF